MLPHHALIQGVVVPLGLLFWGDGQWHGCWVTGLRLYRDYFLDIIIFCTETAEGKGQEDGDAWVEELWGLFQEVSWSYYVLIGLWLWYRLFFGGRVVLCFGTYTYFWVRVLVS